MSDSGWLSLPDNLLSADNPDPVYDSGSTGGGNQTGAPSSSFSLDHIFDLLSNGIHAFAQTQQPGSPTIPGVPNYSAPPPASTSSPPPTDAPPAGASTTPQWMTDLTDFSKPTPYLAAGGLVLFVALINSMGRGK